MVSLGTSIQMAVWKYSNALDTVNNFLVGSRFVFDLLSANRKLAGRLRLCRFPYPQLEGSIDNDARDEVNLSFIGRLVPHKGILIFAEAISNLQIPIHIFGDGSLLKNTRRILQNNRNAIFHGWTSQKEMAKYLSLGSIVIVPSLAFETFCYVVVEAMMRGCCVVATNRGAIPELIQNGCNGILVDQPTPEKFRTAIERLIAEPEKIYSLGHQARKITNILPSLDVHAQEIVNLYSLLIE